jgi:hypothetical protein
MGREVIIKYCEKELGIKCEIKISNMGLRVFEGIKDDSEKGYVDERILRDKIKEREMMKGENEKEKNEK